MIPDEAVEAAAMALHFFKTGKGWKDADPAIVWECREQAESIIRQAAPYLAAQTLRDAADMVEPFSGIGLANGATRGEVARWLRNKAAEVIPERHA